MELGQKKSFKNQYTRLVWWDIPEMVVLRMLRQEDDEVKTTLDSIESFKQVGHITTRN